MENWSAIFSDFVQSFPFPFSLSLPLFLLASAITRPLPTFAQRISFVEKFYFPLFNAIQMQNPVAVSGTASVLPVRSARCVMHMHTRFFSVIWIYGNIEKEWRNIQTTYPMLQPLVFFISEFFACLHAPQSTLYVCSDRFYAPFFILHRHKNSNPSHCIEIRIDHKNTAKIFTLL